MTTATPTVTAASAPAPMARTPTATLRPKDLMFSTYKPEDGPIETWLVRFDTAVRADETLRSVTWPRDVLFQVAAAKLDRGAATWFGNIAESIDDADHHYDFLKDLLQRQYGRQESVEEVVAIVMGRKKNPRESFVEYATELRALGNGVAIKESWYVTAFTNGVDSLTRGLVR